MFLASWAHSFAKCTGFQQFWDAYDKFEYEPFFEARSCVFTDSQVHELNVGAQRLTIRIGTWQSVPH